MSDKTEEPPKPEWALTHREKKALRAKPSGGRAPRRRWPWAVLVIVGLGAGAYIAQQQGLIGETPDAEEVPVAATPEVEEAPAREVVMQLLPREITEVAPGVLRETVRITGSLSPDQHLGIPAEVAGRVDAVNKRAGDRVEAGEVLVQIDLATLQNQLEQSEATADATRAQLEYATGELQRTQSLVDRGVATSSNLDSAQANVQQLRANLSALEQQVATARQSIEKATITAPFAGQIAERNVDPGAYVSPGTPLMTLVDISSLELEGAIPVNYAPRIETGQVVEITVDGFGDRSFEGTVERVAPVAKSGTRVLPIYATIDNPNDVLRGGMFASGLLVLEEVTDAIGIPADAVREDAEGTFVLKRDGDRVVRQPIRAIRTWDRGRIVQVSEGLSQGDVIVSAPMERLQPGMKITLVEG
ncbi:efflux RND transporter periplasmic adaptor subunit [Pseudooceanicola sp. MF1-13]|uniref:efflux RND transporter periplasmic adaptor subunit n=1 Tax=Pseudooceanicola sp. MF1-13 TaxID=3379095 RepID=UPI00389182EA